MNAEERMAALAAIEKAREDMKAVQEEHGGSLPISDSFKPLLPDAALGREYAWAVGKALFSQPALQRLCLGVAAMRTAPEDILRNPREMLLNSACFVLDGAVFGAAAMAAAIGVDEKRADMLLLKIAGFRMEGEES